MLIAACNIFSVIPLKSKKCDNFTPDGRNQNLKKCSCRLGVITAAPKKNPSSLLLPNFLGAVRSSFQTAFSAPKKIPPEAIILLPRQCRKLGTVSNIVLGSSKKQFRSGE